MGYFLRLYCYHMLFSLQLTTYLQSLSQNIRYIFWPELLLNWKLAIASLTVMSAVLCLWTWKKWKSLFYGVGWWPFLFISLFLIFEEFVFVWSIVRRSGFKLLDSLFQDFGAFLSSNLVLVKLVILFFSLQPVQKGQECITNISPGGL